ncbi:Putative LOC101237757 [Caligus rogercresseyi]|uniref:LOC101237757 n=1 Tax=Caligus rogercresseyi TaxID=217165 RepID=A0A7T8JTR2_CALRO|nr:Putative LOC101237757 [Caligus rogercresseyi]
MIEGVDVIVGMDVLKHHIITLDRGQVKLNSPPSVCSVKEAPLLKMKGRNFEGVFDGNEWVVKWSWKRELILQNKISEYRMREDVKRKFDSEVERWIENGWPQAQQ